MATVLKHKVVKSTIKHPNTLVETIKRIFTVNNQIKELKDFSKLVYIETPEPEVIKIASKFGVIVYD
jgi:hypothetical protein